MPSWFSSLRACVSLLKTSSRMGASIDPCLSTFTATWWLSLSMSFAL